MAIMSEIELFRACQILFGPGIGVSHEFLEYIQPSGIKSAYRRLARVTHPDAARGGDGEISHNRFIEANWAYESLTEYISRRERMQRLKVFRRAGQDTVRRPPKRRGRKYSAECSVRPRGNYYSGPMPLRMVLFGEYLFYSGMVPWEAFIKAIVWQRNQRPRLGDLARKWGWLSRHEIAGVLQNRRPGEQIGDALIRLNKCMKIQVSALLRTQRKLQKPFGEYFIANGYLRREHVNNVLYSKFLRHNARY